MSATGNTCAFLEKSGKESIRTKSNTAKVKRTQLRDGTFNIARFNSEKVNDYRNFQRYCIGLMRFVWQSDSQADGNFPLMYFAHISTEAM